MIGLGVKDFTNVANVALLIERTREFLIIIAVASERYITSINFLIIHLKNV